MANFFSHICEMNLVSPPQPCSGKRTHKLEFRFSDNSRRQIAVCERHAKNVAMVEKALVLSGEFPEGEYLIATSTHELSLATPLGSLAIAAAK